MGGLAGEVLRLSCHLTVGRCSSPDIPKDLCSCFCLLALTALTLFPTPCSEHGPGEKGCSQSGVTLCVSPREQTSPVPDWPEQKALKVRGESASPKMSCLLGQLQLCPAVGTPPGQPRPALTRAGMRWECSLAQPFWPRRREEGAGRWPKPPCPSEQAEPQLLQGSLQGLWRCQGCWSGCHRRYSNIHKKAEEKCFKV